MRQNVVKNCVDGRLLQNAATLITKCATYYKMPQPLLQNAQVITKCVVITKCRSGEITTTAQDQVDGYETDSDFDIGDVDHSLIDD